MLNTDETCHLTLWLMREQIIHAAFNCFPVYVVCRRGNDSQRAVKILQDKLKDLPVAIKDITGGLTAWAHQIDNDFPVY